MNSTKMEQRLCDLERTMETIQNQLQALEKQVDQVTQIQVMPLPTNTLSESLVQLESFLVSKFPQLAQRVKGSISIPGVTGNGEIGPGNEPMPKVHSGNTRIAPRKRTES